MSEAISSAHSKSPNTLGLLSMTSALNELLLFHSSSLSGPVDRHVLFFPFPSSSFLSSSLSGFPHMVLSLPFLLLVLCSSHPSLALLLSASSLPSSASVFLSFSSLFFRPYWCDEEKVRFPIFLDVISDFFLSVLSCSLLLLLLLLLLPPPPPPPPPPPAAAAAAAAAPLLLLVSWSCLYHPVSSSCVFVHAFSHPPVPVGLWRSLTVHLSPPLGLSLIRAAGSSSLLAALDSLFSLT